MDIIFLTETKTKALSLGGKIEKSKALAQKPPKSQSRQRGYIRHCSCPVIPGRNSVRVGRQGPLGRANMGLDLGNPPPRVVPHPVEKGKGHGTEDGTPLVPKSIGELHLKSRYLNVTWRKARWPTKDLRDYGQYFLLGESSPEQHFGW